MKNLFEISSEEKQRILEMHVSATKRNYLSELDTTQATTQPTTQPTTQSTTQATTQPTGTTQTITQSPDLSNLGIKTLNGGVKVVEVPQKQSRNIEEIAKQTGDKVYGVGKYEIMSEVGGNYPLMLVVKKEAYQKLLSDKGITVVEGEHCSEPKWTGKKDKNNPTGWVHTFKVGNDSSKYVVKPLPWNLFNKILNERGTPGCPDDRVNRHIHPKVKGDYSGGNFMNSDYSQASKNFFDNPNSNQAMNAFCSGLKPTSFYRINGFPGVSAKCPVFVDGSDEDMERSFSTNDYIRIQTI